MDLTYTTIFSMTKSTEANLVNIRNCPTIYKLQYKNFNFVMTVNCSHADWLIFIAYKSASIADVIARELILDNYL